MAGSGWQRLCNEERLQGRVKRSQSLVKHLQLPLLGGTV